MNQKKAKRIRADLSDRGVDVKDARYEETGNPGARVHPQTGKLVSVFGALTLVANCGRKLYKSAKAAA
jgi:hypothetical protein